MSLLLSLFLAATPSPEVIHLPEPEPLPEKVLKIVVIGKAKYQVTIRGSMAEVRRENISYRRDAQYFVLAQQAAETASGCVVVNQVVSDDGLFAGPVIMTLNCPD